MLTKGALTRLKIIDRSLQLFTVKGYYNTSINDILNATNLTKGGLYGHFRSKEEIWYAVYDQAVVIWRGIVFKNSRSFKDPMERLEDSIVRDMRNYLGANVFKGGCFFLIMLVELAGQHPAMSRHIIQGFNRYSDLYYRWLMEADEQGMLKPDLNLQEIASYLVLSLNGAGSIYSATRDPKIWKQTITQLKFYISQLKA